MNKRQKGLPHSLSLSRKQTIFSYCQRVHANEAIPVADTRYALQLIDSQSCGRRQRRGDLNLSGRGRRWVWPALSCPYLNMGLLKRHMEFMRAQGLRQCCQTQSEWQTENDKEATANKEQRRAAEGGSSVGSGVGLLSCLKVLPTYLSLGHF